MLPLAEAEAGEKVWLSCSTPVTCPVVSFRAPGERVAASARVAGLRRKQLEVVRVSPDDRGAGRGGAATVSVPIIDVGPRPASRTAIRNRRAAGTRPRAPTSRASSSRIVTSRAGSAGVGAGLPQTASASASSPRVSGSAGRNVAGSLPRIERGVRVRDLRGGPGGFGRGRGGRRQRDDQSRRLRRPERRRGAGNAQRHEQGGGESQNSPHVSCIGGVGRRLSVRSGERHGCRARCGGRIGGSTPTERSTDTKSRNGHEIEERDSAGGPDERPSQAR